MTESSREESGAEGPAADAPEELTFEQALARLEAVAHDLEDGQIGLTESLACYEEGIKLLRQCFLLLENAERRIELLSQVNAAGEATTEPFDEGAAGLEEKASQRSRRRTRKPGPALGTGDEPEATPPGSQDTKRDGSKSGGSTRGGARGDAARGDGGSLF